MRLSPSSLVIEADLHFRSRNGRHDLFRRHNRASSRSPDRASTQCTSAVPRRIEHYISKSSRPWRHAGLRNLPATHTLHFQSSSAGKHEITAGCIPTPSLRQPDRCAEVRLPMPVAELSSARKSTHILPSRTVAAGLNVSLHPSDRILPHGAEKRTCGSGMIMDWPLQDGQSLPAPTRQPVFAVVRTAAWTTATESSDPEGQQQH